jgi:hypothetical protein
MRLLGTACLPLGIRTPAWTFDSTLPSVEKEKQQKVLSCPVFWDHPIRRCDEPSPFHLCTHYIWLCLICCSPAEILSVMFSTIPIDLANPSFI